MALGAFSISLAVEDLEASKVFYEKLGFEVIGGDPLENCRFSGTAFAP